MSRVISLAGAGLFLAFTEASVLPYAPIHRRQNSTSANETAWATFDNVASSPEINWVDCYGPSRQCTKLTVPLDYEHPDVGTTDIAFIRYIVSEDAEDLLFNPGGPGQPATSFVSADQFGEKVANTWGYNFIAFDPRGTGHTGPELPCQPANNTGSSTPAPPRTANGTIGDLSKQWNENLAMAEACAAANKYTTAKYIGTSAVAQDLIHFTELQAAAKGKDPKEALINYYGISYGTVLGQTLAALYPNRLRRVLLDGNVYGVGFYQGWVPNTVDDLDHSVWLFAKLCFEAGAEYCKLSKEASSIAEIESRFANVVDVLEKQPVDIGGTPYGPNEFLSMVQQGLYTPRRGSQGSYRKIDTWASAILSGNTSAIDPTSLIKREEQPFSVNAQLLITAVDISGRYPWQTYEQWKAAANKLHVTAPEWAQNYASTNGLVGLIDIEPPASQLFPGFEKVETSAPILFVNTVADPVTPASSARQMSRLFEGSGVLIVDGPGHGYTNAPSECANEKIAAYWENGQVHAGETWCQTSADASYYFGGPIPEAAFDQEAP